MQTSSGFYSFFHGSNPAFHYQIYYEPDALSAFKSKVEKMDFNKKMIKILTFFNKIAILRYKYLIFDFEFKSNLY